MINLKLVSSISDIVSAGGQPQFERSISVYSDGFGRYVRIVEFVYITTELEWMHYEIEVGGDRLHGNSWEKLDETLQVNGLTLGDWSDDEMVRLTPLGEEQASLLTSIPYLSRRIGFAG